jgi:hypothetical protein
MAKEQPKLDSYWMTSEIAPNLQRLILYKDNSFSHFIHSDVGDTQHLRGSYKFRLSLSGRDYIDLTYSNGEIESMETKLFNTNIYMTPKLHMKHPLFKTNLTQTKDWSIYFRNNKSFSKLTDEYYKKHPNKK